MILTSGYDAASNRTSLKASISGTNDFQNAYTYDGLSRLTRVDQWSQTGGNTVAEKRVDFSYNAVDLFTGIARYKDTDGGSANEATTSYCLSAGTRSIAADSRAVAGWTGDVDHRRCDDQGRMVKHSQTTVDGTFLGPDAAAELVAMHLHRLGAAKAQCITFVADGGVWIWDRIPLIVRLAKLGDVPVYEVLDCCHAIHHISLALAAYGLNEKQRMPLYREHRTLLRNGQWRRVVDELTELATDAPPDSGIWTEIAYLQKHGEAGRLKYPTFRSLGVPLGSGAIESNIRRVVNLRLKGNSIFWREDNAEAMLQLRAQVLTNRWDERLAELHKLKLRDARTDWRWAPQDMRSQTELTAPGTA